MGTSARAHQSPALNAFPPRQFNYLIDCAETETLALGVILVGAAAAKSPDHTPSADSRQLSSTLGENESSLPAGQTEAAGSALLPLTSEAKQELGSAGHICGCPEENSLRVMGERLRWAQLQQRHVPTQNRTTFGQTSEMCLNGGVGVSKFLGHSPGWCFFSHFMNEFLVFDLCDSHG